MVVQKQDKCAGNLLHLGCESNCFFRLNMPKSISHSSEFFNNLGLIMQYSSWGHGKHVLIVFHGFGRSYTDFIPFTAELESIFTIYGVDLFFHGESNIGDRKPDETPLDPSELSQYFEAFLKYINTDQVWLLGYSLGGRIALKLAELLPQNVAGLYLFAPDGLSTNFWYAASSLTSPGRSAFRFMINHNEFFYKMLNFLHSIGIVSGSRKSFVLSQIKTEKEQWKVYNVWTFLRKIKPDFEKLGEILDKNAISVDLFLGKYDTIIPPKTVKTFQKNFPGLKCHIIESGHAILKPRIMQELLEKGLLKLPE